MKPTLQVSKYPWLTQEEYKTGGYGTFDTNDDVFSEVEARTRNSIINCMNQRILFFYNGTIGLGVTDDINISEFVEVCGVGEEDPCPTTQFLNKTITTNGIQTGILVRNPNWKIDGISQIDEGKYLNQYAQEQLKKAQTTYINAQATGWNPYFETIRTINVTNNGTTNNTMGTFKYATEFDQLPKETRMCLRAMMINKTLQDPEFILKIDSEGFVSKDTFQQIIIYLENLTASQVGLVGFDSFVYNGTTYSLNTEQEAWNFVKDNLLSGSFDAQFITEVNGQRIKVRQTEITFYNSISETSTPRLVDMSIIENRVKEYTGTFDPINKNPLSVYVNNESSVTPGTGVFGDLADTSTQNKAINTASDLPFLPVVVRTGTPITATDVQAAIEEVNDKIPTAGNFINEFDGSNTLSANSFQKNGSNEIEVIPEEEAENILFTLNRATSNNLTFPGNNSVIGFNFVAPAWVQNNVANDIFTVDTNGETNFDIIKPINTDAEDEDITFRLETIYKTGAISNADAVEIYIETYTTLSDAQNRTNRILIFVDRVPLAGFIDNENIITSPYLKDIPAGRNYVIPAFNIINGNFTVEALGGNATITYDGDTNQSIFWDSKIQILRQEKQI